MENTGTEVELTVPDYGDSGGNGEKIYRFLCGTAVVELFPLLLEFG